MLRAGGRLLLHENHPLTGQCLIEEEGQLKVTQAYGDKTPEYYPFHIKDFVSKERQAVEFSHTMAEILNAIMQAGFIMERMIECNADQARFPLQGMAGLPHDFFVGARK